MKIEQYQLFLADDDTDDYLFFRLAFEELKIPDTLQTVSDGVALMDNLSNSQRHLPNFYYIRKWGEFSKWKNVIREPLVFTSYNNL